MADHKQEGRESPRSESLHLERYTISKDFDHILVVIPSSIITRFVNGVFEERRGPPQAAYEFEVKLEALHKIDYFRRTLPLDKAEHSTSELLDDDPHAWAIWLRLVHECLENKDYKAQVSTVWHVLRIADKYGIDPKRADSGKWFDEWFFVSVKSITSKVSKTIADVYSSLWTDPECPWLLRERRRRPSDTLPLPCI